MLRFPARRLAHIALISLFSLSLAATGCKKDSGGGAAGGGSTKVLKLAFVSNNASEFWKIASAGIRKYEQEAKVQVDVKMPPNGSTDEQNQILQNLSSQGYDCLLYTSPSPRDS